MGRPYAHLLPVDVAVWERYLHRFATRYTHLEYDVRVGLGRDPGSPFDDTMRSMALDLSMRRIDAVGFTPERITVIEITHSAGMTALGQLRAYPTLYRLTYMPDLPLSTLLVAADLQSDIQVILEHEHIPYVLV